MIMNKELKKALEKRKEILGKIEKAENREQLDSLELELRKSDLEIAELRKEPEEETEERTLAVNGTPAVVTASAEVRTSVEDSDMEYRRAFQQFVTRGTEIPAELREDANTLKSDIPGALPTVLVDRIVEKMETFGMVLPLVNKTSLAAGISIPTSAVKPSAVWVAEGAGSDRQKKTTATSITFTNFKLRCEISMSMEASTMALASFEAAFVRQVSEAMVKALESAIISGAWNEAGSALVGPKGILDETPATGQALKFSALTYGTLIDAEAALPQAYESNVVWCMTKKTFMSFIGMVDENGQPIARINYGIGGKPERMLLGRSVVLCGDYMDSFSTSLTDGDVFAFLFNFSDYSLNTIYDMGIQRKQDWDTEDLLTKAVMSVDGKVIDKNSLVTLEYEAVDPEA